MENINEELIINVLTFHKVYKYEPLEISKIYSNIPFYIINDIIEVNKNYQFDNEYLKTLVIY